MNFSYQLFILIFSKIISSIIIENDLNSNLIDETNNSKILTKSFSTPGTIKRQKSGRRVAPTNEADLDKLPSRSISMLSKNRSFPNLKLKENKGKPNKKLLKQKEIVEINDSKNEYLVIYEINSNIPSSSSSKYEDKNSISENHKENIRKILALQQQKLANTNKKEDNCGY
uniref:Uncharacterized protein n=1 Tax=Meloidogyne hapla TaxID=6305 RepID=A0A1I8BQH3_MELHA